MFDVETIDRLRKAAREAGGDKGHLLACKRVKVRDVVNILPRKYLEALEHNQQIATCCRHPEDHEIAAFYSKPEEEAPDVYILFCGCGRRHRRFCIGLNFPGREPERRAFWE